MKSSISIRISFFRLNGELSKNLVCKQVFAPPVFNNKRKLDVVGKIVDKCTLSVDNSNCQSLAIRLPII